MTNQLNHVLDQFENTITQANVVNKKVSDVAVGWHIDHSLITVNLIIDALKNANPVFYTWSFNFKKILIFTTNKIPRGKAKAPKRVQPNNTFSIENLQERLLETKQKLHDLKDLHSNSYFEHPYFGKLNLKATLKFLTIHTTHHQKIIADILKE